jgi:predicted dehydrogenase
MSTLTVRLALVGPLGDVATCSKAVRRMRDAQVVITADSMEAALRGNVEFDAAVVHSFADALRAVQSGKHVLVDAPVADSIDEVESLLEAVNKSGVVLNVGRLLRHTPAIQTIMNRLISGKLGAPGLLRVHRWTCLDTHSLATRTFGDIAQAIEIFGSQPTNIYAIGRASCSYLQIHFGFPQGGMAVLDYAGQLPDGPDYDSLSIIGSTGAAYADDHHNTQLLFAGQNPTALISDSGNSRCCELQEFVRQIADSKSPARVKEMIVAVHRVIDGVRRSMESCRALQEQRGSYEPV